MSLCRMMSRQSCIAPDATGRQATTRQAVARCAGCVPRRRGGAGCVVCITKQKYLKSLVYVNDIPREIDHLLCSSQYE